MQRRIDTVADKYGRAFPSAVKCLPTDREHQLPALPTRTPPSDRHSNFIERPFGETHRPVKVIVRLPGEPC